MSVSKAVLPGADSHESGKFMHSRHLVQFYRKDRALVEEVGKHLGAALAGGDSAIVIATQAHREALDDELRARGIDTGSPELEGRYKSFDAAEILPQIMSDAMPDRARFMELIGAAIDRAKAAATSGRPCVAVFGEMVAILWAEGKHTAAVRLEQLWNELGKIHSFSLRCAYPMSGFSKPEHGELFLTICDQHSAVCARG